MKILTTPWKDDFLELVFQSKKSIKITSPFVKKGICSELFSVKNESTKFELITSFRLMNLYSGSLDIAAMEIILGNNGIIKNFPKLHSKIYLFDEEKAVITSGNLTRGGLLSNFEYGVLIKNKRTVKRISEDITLLSKNENTGVVKMSDIEWVKKILNKLPKYQSIKLPSLDIKTPEEKFDVIEIDLRYIQSSLSGWKLNVFNSINTIPTQTFDLQQVYSFENQLQTLHPKNHNVKEKIRQQLQNLRDLGLIEFLGSGKYKKLWN